MAIQKVYPPFGSPMDGPGGLVARPWVIFFNWIFELLSTAGDVSVTGAPSAGELVVWSGASSITNGNLSGDVTTSGSLVTTLAASGVTPGVYGDASNVGAFIVDAKGRLTAAANVPIAAGGTVTHTGALTANQLVLGNAGADIKPLGSAGTVTQVLHGNAAGAPSFGAVDLAADVTGDLPFANLVPATGASKLVGRQSGSAGDFGEITLGTNLSMSGSTLNAAGGTVNRVVGILIDGAGSVIATGLKGFVSVPFSGTIVGWTILSADVSGPATSGAIVVDVWKAAYASYPPTVANTIAGTDKPTIVATNKKNTDSTLTGWGSTTVTAGDVFAFNVDSCTSLSRVLVELTVQQ
jgi:hypothetical protein